MAVNGWIIERTVDLAHPPKTLRNEQPYEIAYTGDMANPVWRVHVLQDGQPVALGGSVKAYIRRIDGAEVISNGTISGNTVSVELGGSNFGQPGYTWGILRYTDSTTNATITLDALSMLVQADPEGTSVLDPDDMLPTLQELLAELDDMRDATAAAEAAVSFIAGEYSSSGTYAVGDYSIHSCHLYRCTTAIDTAETWTDEHWTQVVFGGEVRDLKSVMGYDSKVIEKAFPNSSGVVESTNAYNLYCYKVASSGTISFIKVDTTSEQLVYAFYASEPELGSTSNENTRHTMSAGVYEASDIFVPAASTWVAVRAKNPPIVTLSFINDISKAPINKLAAFTFSDLNDIVSDSIYYVSKSRVPTNYPPELNVCYVQTVVFNQNNKLQLAYDINGTKAFLRTKSSDVWSDWKSFDSSALEFANNVLSKAITQITATGISDANAITENSFVYVSANYVSNLPSSGAWYLWTANLDTNNAMQLAYEAHGTKPYIRAKVAGTWASWGKIGQEAATDVENDIYVSSTIALFPSVGCCGDSFTAGYLYNKPDSQWYDQNYVPNGEYPAIGYPAVMGRLYGVEVTAYAQGGLTSTAFRTASKGLPALLADAPKYLYVIALGLNDKTQNIPIGVEADIDIEPSTPTYLGNMGAIIRAIKAHAPYSRIILCKSLWMVQAYYDYISQGVELLSSHLGIPYIETAGDPYFESDEYKNGLKGLHPTAPLYAGMGKRIGELVGRCVIDNPQYFFNFYVPNN